MDRMKRAKLFLFVFLAGLPAVWGIASNGRDQASTGANPQLFADPNSTQGTRVPVTAELFTSEGCSSCPPADALLARLVRDQSVRGAEVIALGEHVDYWNRLGWADVYSSAAFSARQGDYARRFGSGSVYTPQMVIDGRVEFVGSDERRAREAIAAAAQTPKLSIQLTRLDNKPGEELDKVPLQIRIESMPDPGAAEDAEILLAATEDDLESNVTRGENAGRRLRHAAVVRSMKRIGRANSHAKPAFAAESVVDISPEWNRRNLRAVVLVQEERTRRVLGAAAIDLAGQ